MLLYFISQDGDTPLMAATHVSEVECIRILVTELGCNKDARNKVCINRHELLLVYVQ